MGAPRPKRPLGLMDRLRYQVALKHLAIGSVLDVGAYFGDFLELARARGHKVMGTEINEARCGVANDRLGADTVIPDFRDGRFETFASDSVDNVVCMEVLEHLPDDATALGELCRVARSRVVITVPYEEQILEERCIHCHKLTPRHGHLRRYDATTFPRMLTGSPWRVLESKPFGTSKTRRLLRPIPIRSFRRAAAEPLDRFLCRGLGCKGTWLLVVLAKQQPAAPRI